MPAFDLAAPEPQTWDNTGGYTGGVIPEQSPDPYSVALRDALNAQVPYMPTMGVPTFPLYVRATDNGPGDNVWSPDGVYTQPFDYEFTSRYGASNYAPMVQPMITRYEAPEPQYGLLSYHELVQESTLSYNQGAPGHQLTQALRAPGINEGI